MYSPQCSESTESATILKGVLIKTPSRKEAATQTENKIEEPSAYIHFWVSKISN